MSKPFKIIDDRIYSYDTFDSAEKAAWRKAADGGSFAIHGPGGGGDGNGMIAVCGVDARGRKYTDINLYANERIAFNFNKETV